MKPTMIQLGEVCDFTYGDSLKEENRRGGKVPVYGSNGVVGWHDSPLTRGPAIIIGRKGSIGEVNWSNEPCFPIDTTYYVEQTKKPCDLRWLYFTLLKLDLTRFNKSAAVPGLNRDDAYEKLIPFPDLSEQQRIARELERADGLRRTRRYALELADTFLPAAFREMFGDPVQNPKRFELATLEDELDRIESGFSPVCEGQRKTPDDWAVLSLGAVKSGEFFPEENKRLPADITPRPEIEVKHGDLLVTRKNTYDLVAAAVYVRNPPPKLLLPDTIFRFCLKSNGRLNSAFLSSLLSFPTFKKTVQSLASGSAGSMPNISKEKFMGVRLPVPPLPLQTRFAELVERHERLRSVQRESLRQAEHLFQSLLHEAFATE